MSNHFPDFFLAFYLLLEVKFRNKRAGKQQQKHNRCQYNVSRDENPQRENEMDSPNFEGFHRAQSRLLCLLINPSSLPPKRATICQIQIYICELPNTQPCDTFKCQRGTLCTLSYLNGQKFQFSIFLDGFNVTDSQANLISKGIFFESQMTVLLCLYRKSDLSKNIIKFYPKQKLWERL